MSIQSITTSLLLLIYAPVLWSSTNSSIADQETSHFEVEGAFPNSQKASSVEESFNNFKKRRNHVRNFILKKYWNSKVNNHEEDRRGSYGPFVNFAISGLLSQDAKAIDLVNKSFENGDIQSWNYGSSFSLANLAPLCRREGDYDFVSFFIAAIGILGQNPDHPLSPLAQEKLLEALPKFGPPLKEHINRFQLEGGICKAFGPIFHDTENHVLMIEISRYLTNQIKNIDNESNGFNLWMVDHLELFLHRFYNEYNSKPYQSFAMQPILVLASLADDQRVRDTAIKVIDMTMAVMATQSNNFRRFSPFRRQPVFKDNSSAFDGNSAYSIPAFLTGAYGEKLRISDASLTAGLLLDKSPLSPATTSLYIHRDSLQYSQRFKYKGNQELYYRSPSFLISAAGQYHEYDNCAEAVLPFIPKCANDDEHGWATATVVVPSASKDDSYEKMLHFAGHKNLKKRKNLCVAEDFACGFNLNIPESYLKCPTMNVDNWTFIDLDSSADGCQLGFKVAYQLSTCESPECKEAGDNYGLLSTDDSTDSMSEFMDQILANASSSIELDKSSSFVNSKGSEIEYLISPNGSLVILDDMKTWAKGDIINVFPGRVDIHSPNASASHSMRPIETCKKDWELHDSRCYRHLSIKRRWSLGNDKMAQVAHDLCAKEKLDLYRWKRTVVLRGSVKRIHAYCH